MQLRVFNESCTSYAHDAAETLLWSSHVSKSTLPWPKTWWRNHHTCARRILWHVELSLTRASLDGDRSYTWPIQGSAAQDRSQAILAELTRQSGPSYWPCDEELVLVAATLHHVEQLGSWLVGHKFHVSTSNHWPASRPTSDRRPASVCKSISKPDNEMKWIRITVWNRDFYFLGLFL